jgi:acyl-CoA synthetase (AMP-forming)/AMP-acid ligase II
VDLEALQARCAENLSGYKRPVAIHVLDALPRNAVGKVTKPVLRDQHHAQPSKQKVK